jgi:hypothetical protein
MQVEQEDSADRLIRLRGGDLDWRLVEGEVVVLDGRESLYLAANRAGAALWPLLAAGATRGALVECLQEEFGIDEQAAARDVDAFVAELDRRGLLDG